jgi:hypothetical protein
METNMMTIWNYLKKNHPENSIDNYLVLYFLFTFGLDRKKDLESFILSLNEDVKSSEVEIRKPQMKVVHFFFVNNVNFDEKKLRMFNFRALR